MSGLQPTIRRRVRTLNSSSHPQLMKMARGIKEEMAGEDEVGEKHIWGCFWGQTDQRSGPRPYPFHRELGFSNSMGQTSNLEGWSLGRNRQQPGSPSLTHNKFSPSGSVPARRGEGDHRGGEGDRRGLPEKARGLRHISYHELMERRSKGLYFRADRQLRLLVLGENETLNLEGEIVEIEVEDSEEEEELECKAMGLFSLGEEDRTGNQTMRIDGVLQGVAVVVLVDSGATHNFISTQLAQALGLKVHSTERLGIRLGDGHQVIAQGKCTGLLIRFGDIDLQIDAYVLELGGMDVILGVAWLKTLGKVLMDWQEMTMEFQQRGRRVTLQGNSGNVMSSKSRRSGMPNSSPLYSFLEAITVEIGGIRWLHTLFALEAGAQNELTDHQQLELSCLMDNYAVVFLEIKGDFY